MIKKLFPRNPARIGRFEGPPTSDASRLFGPIGTTGDLKADLIASWEKRTYSQSN